MYQLQCPEFAHKTTVFSQAESQDENSSRSVGYSSSSLVPIVIVSSAGFWLTAAPVVLLASFGAVKLSGCPTGGTGKRFRSGEPSKAVNACEGSYARVFARLELSFFAKNVFISD